MVESFRSQAIFPYYPDLFKLKGMILPEIRAAFMIDEVLRTKIDGKTKPPGSLGFLERLAFQMGRFQNRPDPEVEPGCILVFAADHGAVASGASAYPKEVTQQMVKNILSGGAAISSLAKLHGLGLKVIDSGVDGSFEEHPDLIPAKTGMGTQDHSKGPAMSEEELELCEREGERIVEQCAHQGYRVLGFGEMGIGNSASASAIMALLHDRPLDECVGMGAGSVGQAFQKKKELLESSLSRVGALRDPRAILRQLGGFEIAQMQAAMKAAHRKGILVLVDGFISTLAFSLAYHQEADLFRNATFSHVSEEKGHELLLKDLGGDPLLRLSMRLGEGTGAAMAYPILRSAAAFLRDMASFEEAGVSGHKKEGE